MKSLHFLAVVGMLVLTANTAMADEAVVHEPKAMNEKALLPVGIRAEVGTLGYGGAFIWKANPYVNLVLGYDGGKTKWTDDLTVNGSKYKTKMDNNNVYLNAEMHPFGKSENLWVNGLYVAAGVAYLDHETTLDRHSYGDSIQVNGNAYSYSGQIKGKMNHKNNLAPYIGFGVSPQFTRHWGAFGEVGAYYANNPTVTLAATGTTTTSFNSDLAIEQNALHNDDKYQWLPVAKVGVNFYW